MPKSRIRTKRGRAKKISHADVQKIDAAFNKKFDEYDKMRLEELIELRKQKKVKGSYLRALNIVIEIKEKPKEVQEKKTA